MMQDVADAPPARATVDARSGLPEWMDEAVRRGRRPLLMYHGTKRAFANFDPRFWDDEPGFFFTPRLAYARSYARNGGRVLAAYLRMTNRYRCDEDAWGHARGLGLAEARDAGHDGYVVAPYSLGTMFVVWDPASIHVVSHDIDAGDGWTSRLAA